MFAGRKSVAFFAVAPPIRQHEVVRQIHRVSGPSDKVIYMRCLPNNPAIAVEAPPVLKIEQNRPVSGHQKSSFFRLLPEASNIIAPKAQSSVRSSRWRIVARVAGTQTSPIDGLRPRRCLNPDCNAMFALCRSCDRGQRYCSDPCRKRMLRRQLLAAGHRYQASEAGKEAHRHRQSHLSATEIPGGCDASGSGFDHHLATDSLGVLDSMRHLRASQPLDEPVLLATG